MDVTRVTECPGCGADLDQWNVGRGMIRYCPDCGKPMGEERRRALWDRIEQTDYDGGF